MSNVSELDLVNINAGGLLFKVGNSNMQHVTSLSFLLLAYANYASHANVRVPCGGSSASPVVLRRVAKRQVRWLPSSLPRGTRRRVSMPETRRLRRENTLTR